MGSASALEEMIYTERLGHYLPMLARPLARGANEDSPPTSEILNIRTLPHPSACT
jgi:hypothetical protein